VTDNLIIESRIQAVLAKRTASSSCCGAKLSPGAKPQAFTCGTCGNPCERVLSGPEKVVFNG
jgi:predicted RNA-binding Zn-ribbon protein involved in translation (DUF1610 family)